MWRYGHALSHMVGFPEKFLFSPGYFVDKVSARGPPKPVVLVHVDNWPLKCRGGIVVHGLQRMAYGY